jgi:hypothetical protein
MALIHLDGFDHWSTATLVQMYSSVHSSLVIESGARTGSGNVLRVNSSVSTANVGALKSIVTPASTVTVGFAFYASTFDSSAADMIRFLDVDGVVHLGLALTSTGDIQVYRSGAGGTLLATSAGAVVTEQWYYFEFQSTIHDSTGTYAVKQGGGTTLLSATNQDTRNGGTLGQVAYVQIGHIRAGSSHSANWKFDDFYIRNDSTYMGDIKAALKTVSGAGNSAQFTPSACSNYQNVDDTTPDGDTTYNSSNTASQKDTFATASLGLTGTPVVKAVNIITSVRKDDAGSRTHRNVIRSGSTDFEGSDFAPLTTYSSAQSIWETDPNTASAWTYSNADAIQIGYKVQA